MKFKLLEFDVEHHNIFSFKVHLEELKTIQHKKMLRVFYYDL